MNLQDAAALALQVPCPVCKMAADLPCVDVGTLASLDRPHGMRLSRAVVVTDAIRHNEEIN